MPGPFNDPAATSGFDMTEAYRRASSLRPVKAKDLRAVYRPYGKDLKIGQARRKSDTKLYARATEEVLEWWKNRSRAPRKRRASGGGGRAVQRASSQTSSGGRRAGGSAQTGASLPDTSTSTRRRTTTATRLPDILPMEGDRVNRSAPSTRNGVQIQRPAGRGFTQYGI